MPELKRYGHYIGGKEVPPVGGAYFPTENPYTGRVWAEIARGSAADVQAAVASARSAFTGSAWAGLTATARGKLLQRSAISSPPMPTGWPRSSAATMENSPPR